MQKSIDTRQCNHKENPIIERNYDGIFIFKNSFSNTDIKDEACQYSYKTRGISFQGMTLKYWGSILFHVQW